MRYLGAPDARPTQYVNDGGIDVDSSHFIAQVKNYSSPVGVAAIREFAGVVAVDGRRGLFFAACGYADGAARFAEQSGIALFAYEAISGTLIPANDSATHIATHGLGSVAANSS